MLPSMVDCGDKLCCRVAEADMLITEFRGRVYPTALKISVSPPPVSWPYGPTKLEANFRVTVKKSAVSVLCETSEYSDLVFQEIYKRALDLASGAVDIVAIRASFGCALVFEEVIHPNGIRASLLPEDTRLRALMPVFEEGPNFDRILKLVLLDYRIIHAVADLREIISRPNVTAVNCGRAMDRLRGIIGNPKSSISAQWAEMRAALRVSLPYLKFITDHSAEHRHGEATYIDAATSGEITTRTWKVMNRFFEYKLRDKLLPEADFPEL